MNNISTETPKGENTNNNKDEVNSEPFSLNTTVREVISDPAFGAINFWKKNMMHEDQAGIPKKFFYDGD